MAARGNNKKGTVTVFLCMILSSTLLLAGMFGEAAAGLASRTYANAVFDLAGRSILSEYDRRLKSQYGIFGFVMEEDAIEQALSAYAEESFTSGPGKTSLLSLEIEEIFVDLSEHALTNPDLLEEQIVEHMGYRVFFDMLNILDALKFLDDKDRSPTADPDPDMVEKKMRTLRSGKMIRELPSRLLQGMDGGFKNILDIPSPKDMGRIAYNELCLNLYILKYFRHDLDSSQWSDTFFSNEIEYILCGRLSDESNRNIVYGSLLAFRTAINAAHIYSDTNKWELVTLAAAATGGGIAAQAAITAAWAGAEAVSDMNRLGKGKKVPLLKTAEDWVLSLDHVLNGTPDMEGVISDEEEGLRYEEYLFLLLCFKDRESKLIRIMDLIQINMKGMVSEHFAMSRCSSGFRFESTVFRQTGFPGMFSFRRGEFSGVHVY